MSVSVSNQDIKKYFSENKYSQPSDYSIQKPVIDESNVSDEAFQLGGVQKKQQQGFENSTAIDRINRLTKKFQKKPDIYVKKPGGIAIWKNPDFFYEIIVKDESILHEEPEKHCDFLYGGILIEIPDDKLPKILSLSKSIYYDKLKKVLYSRCHFLGAVIATLMLSIQILHNPKQVSKIKKNYNGMIEKSMNKDGFNEIYNNLESEVSQNKNTFENPKTNCSVKNSKNNIYI